MPAIKHLLFVDDEPNILAGLKRMLRPMRHEWDMVFCESGHDALAQMAVTPADVVVTDMRMPGMDGAELLRRVMEKYPETVRIVLSGQADRESILNAVGPIHQYLSKPCDADTLKSTLLRACHLDDLLPNGNLKRIISQMETLPSLPSLYDEVLDELQSPDASTTALGQIISKDMGMSAKVLQLVNSAFFGLRSHIPSPTQAVILLGLDTVKILGLSARVFSQFDPVGLESLPPLKMLWEHSVGVSEFARKIAQAENADQKTIDYASIAGLLHDVGKLVLAAHFPQQYGQVIDRVMKNGLDLLEAERHELGATHTEVGAYLIGLWGLPAPIVDALYFHHRPQDYPLKSFSPVIALYTANILEYQCSAREKIGAVTEMDVAYLAELKLDHRLAVWQEACTQLR